MKNAGHDESIKKATFLMVCSGETYFTEIVYGEKVFDRMMVAQFGDDWKENVDAESVQSHHDEFEEPDNWSMDSNFGPTRFEINLEDGNISLFLITDTDLLRAENK